MTSIRKGIIILLSGRKYSGKDTVADYIVKNYNFTKMSYADILKDQVIERYSLPRHYFYNPEFKEIPLINYPVQLNNPIIKLTYSSLNSNYQIIDSKLYHTPRSLLILEGTYCARSISNTIWIDLLMNKIKKNNLSKVVIADVRFCNEITIPKETLSSYQIISVRVNRNLYNITSTDLSETELDDYDFDHIINNNDSFETLNESIENMLNKSFDNILNIKY